MLRVAYHLLQNAEDAMECVNDACLGTWNAIPPARPDVLSAYVCRITKNQALNRLRRNGAKIYFFLNELAQDGGPTLYLRKSSFTQEEAESFDGDLWIF